MTTIYVARHGDYRNDEKVVPFGLSGFPLNDRGKRQAKRIAKYLANKRLTEMYSSPVLRCKQTAEIIGEALNAKPKYSELITETDTPAQGMVLDEFFHTAGGYTFMQPIHVRNAGETIKQVFTRCNTLVTKIIKKHEGENVLIVTHGDPLMALVYGLVDKDLRNYFTKTRKYLPKGALVKFEFKNYKLHDYHEVLSGKTAR